MNNESEVVKECVKQYIKSKMKVKYIKYVSVSNPVNHEYECFSHADDKHIKCMVKNDCERYYVRVCIVLESGLEE